MLVIVPYSWSADMCHFANVPAHYYLSFAWRGVDGRMFLFKPKGAI